MGKTEHTVGQIQVDFLGFRSVIEVLKEQRPKLACYQSLKKSRWAPASPFTLKRPFVYVPAESRFLRY